MRLFRKSKHLNNKFLYYLRNIIRYALYKLVPPSTLERKLKRLNSFDEKHLNLRLHYYNKLERNTPLPPANRCYIKDYKLPKKGTVYFFDSFEYLRFFPAENYFQIASGDITYIPELPTIVKSRPISDTNQNSILLNMDKIRHFQFVQEDIPFDEKLNLLVWRGKIRTAQTHRIRFHQLYFNHPLCNIGGTVVDNFEQWKVNFMTIQEQLQYKFILCLEGNDVATNLKWTMSSNSVAVMPHPKYETWFMEGTLIPDHHYIVIKDDYTDLEERLNYFLKHPEKVKKIVQNAQLHVAQFQNKKQEDLLALLVLQKYFSKTEQD